MESMFANEAEKRSDEDLIQFLMDASPLLDRTFKATQDEQKQLEAEFRNRFSVCEDPLPPPPPFQESPVQEVTPYFCGFCRCTVVIHDTENACLVCSNCGISGPIGFEHYYQDDRQVFRPLPYYYAVSYTHLTLPTKA